MFFERAFFSLQRAEGEGFLGGGIVRRSPSFLSTELTRVRKRACRCLPVRYPGGIGPRGRMLRTRQCGIIG